MRAARAPALADPLRRSGPDDPALEWFVQEVRRTSSFFPFQAARARQAFRWRGVGFRLGGLVVLDLCGTDRHHDPGPDPDRFTPDRFANCGGNAFALVPPVASLRR